MGRIKTMNNLTIKDWDPDDRPREKMMTKGVAALSDAELVAILLRSGTASETAVEIAKRVLALGNNNLNELGKIERTRLQKIKGIGATKAVTLLAALELGRRRATIMPTPRTTIVSTHEVVSFMSPLLADIPHEELWLILLNRANRIIEYLKIGQGGISQTIVDNRIILKHAIEKMAAGIILVHNHPSGNASPSVEDVKQTQRLRQAAELFDIRLFDHIIITDGGYYSFTDERK